MRFIATLAAACLVAHAQIPAQDARNTHLPNTDTHFTARTYKTLAEWQTRREQLRRQILAAAGLFPMFPKSDLHPRRSGLIRHADYTVENVLLETLPGFYLGANLYQPTATPPPGGFPAIVAPHGHWTHGRLENTAIASYPALAVSLARQGLVVLTIDMVGYNDTKQTPHDFGTKPEEQLWNFGSLGLQAWNAIRAVDFLESLPNVNKRKLGATGASGGGTQTFLLAATDDRIVFDAPANMVSLTMQGGGVCENAPNLRIETNNVEFAAMMAPHPMMMTSSSGDWTRNMASEEFPAVQAIYALYGKPDKVAYFFQEAPHNYNRANREAIYAFFDKEVLGLAGAYKEPADLAPDPPEKLLALSDAPLPANALTYQQLFEEWQSLARQQSGQTRERLTAALAADWPAQVITQADGDRLLLGRPGKGDRVPAIFIKGRNPPVVIVHPDGADAARQSPEAAKALAAGRSVLLLDTFQTGRAAAPRERTARNFLTFNKSDDAERVQDILTALAWLNTPKTQLAGIGKAGVWCVYAAAVSHQPVELQAADTSGEFFVPGMERAGGLRAALQLAGRR